MYKHINSIITDMHRVFVYGTLMSGMGNHKVLIDPIAPSSEGRNSDAIFVGQGKTIRSFTMYSAGVPFVDPDIETSRIVGEVWDVSTTVLQRLDRLEGHPDWYYRLEVDVELLTDEIVRAEMYANKKFREFEMHLEARLVGNGDFRESLLS